MLNVEDCPACSCQAFVKNHQGIMMPRPPLSLPWPAVAVHPATAAVIQLSPPITVPERAAGTGGWR
jgi:hypothetical protein